MKQFGGIFNCLIFKRINQNILKFNQKLGYCGQIRLCSKNRCKKIEFSNDSKASNIHTAINDCKDKVVNPPAEICAGRRLLTATLRSVRRNDVEQRYHKQ